MSIVSSDPYPPAYPPRLEFGIVYNGTRYVSGKPVSARDISRGVERFNELFERTDPLTLKRLPKAQRRAKPSWVIPWHAEG